MNNSVPTHKKVILAISIILVVAVSILLFIYVARPMLELASTPEAFRSWVDERGAKGVLAYIGITVMQILIAFIPGEPLEIAAGYAFGIFKGTLLCMAATSLGSIIVLVLVRKFGIKLVEIFFSKEKIESLKFLHSSEKRTLIVAIIFIVPGTPKDLLCYFAGLTDIPLPLLLTICTIGRFPSIITSTVGGDALSSHNFLFAVIVFAGTLLLSLGGILLYNKLKGKNGKGKSDDTKPEAQI